MTPRPTPAVPPTAETALPPRRARSAPLPAPPRWPLPLALALLVYMTHPAAWLRDEPFLGFPPAGFALVLVAWFGGRAALWATLAALTASIQGTLLRTDGAGAGRAAWHAALVGFQAWIAWSAYYRVGRAQRRLGEPRSATVFLLTAVGLVPLVGSLLRLGPEFVGGRSWADLGSYLVADWAAQAVGTLVVAPALLAGATGWAVRNRLIVGEPAGEQRGQGDLGPLTAWQQFELIALGLGTAALGAFLAVGLPQRFGGDGISWHLWGAPLLFVVWVSVHQGQRSGTLMASAAGALTLGVAQAVGLTILPAWLLQSNLLAQGATALLVGGVASALRVNEARYRQVVSHTPTVLYSARVTQLDDRGRPPRADITFVSPASQTLFGVAPEVLVGDYDLWLELVHPDDREVVLAALGQLLLQTQPVMCEYRLGSGSEGQVRATPAEGTRRPPEIAYYPSRSRRSERWVRDTLAPQRGPDGQLIGWEGVVSEITAQRLLADDLRRTTSMFNALVANLPAGIIFVHGKEGLPILVNARARQLLAQREDPATGVADFPQTYRLYRPDGTAYPADELPVAAALHRGLVGMREDIVVHRPDGRKVPLVTWAAPIELGSPGQQDAAVWVLEDLTTLQQAEAARRESEARLRTVIETMSEGLVVADHAGVIIESNPAACSLLGLSPEDLHGRSLVDPSWNCLRTDGSEFPREEHPAVACLRTGKPVRNVILGILQQSSKAANGSHRRRWLLTTSVPLTEGRDPAPTRVVTTFSDVTAQRDMLEELRASEEKYRGLVEHLPVMITQWDRTGRLVYLNPAASAQSGYPLEEVSEPLAWQAVVHPEHLPLVLRALDESFGGNQTRTEVLYRARDGSLRYCIALYQPRVELGEVVGATCIAVDLTRERQLEQELQQAQRLEVVGRLTGGIAHDFNNLLTVVLTSVALARQELPKDHPVTEDLKRIDDVSQLAASLARQLLTFSKRRQPRPQLLDVNDLVRRTLALLKPSLPYHVEVETRLPEETLLVKVDEAHLQQILMNLCLNARDAMPGGGQLVVEASREVGEAGEPVWVVLSVGDTGAGMSEEVRKQIFDPFFTTKAQGTGLGLAVVKQIVEGYGGRIGVESEEGRGSRFRVRLPAGVAG